MSIELTITTGGWTFSLFEEDEKGRISVDKEGSISEYGIEREHALYEPIKACLQCINNLTAAIEDAADTVEDTVIVTDSST